MSRVPPIRNETADNKQAPAQFSDFNQTEFTPPTISLPKGGGAVRGMGEKFGTNPVTGTGSLSIPIGITPGRGGFGPQLSLSYDSGAGNGPFGFGWSLALSSITRKTDKGLPRYFDQEESDVFILSGAEDLVPVLSEDNGEWQRQPSSRVVEGVEYDVQSYRPRTEGLFARIERWTDRQTGVIHWRSITRDNVTTLYGKDNNSRIFDPDDPDPERPTRIFTWLICESYDDKGNALLYEYQEEDRAGVDSSLAHEKNRTASSISANRYLKRIKYGNRVSRLVQPDLAQHVWMFEVVLDYGEHNRDDPKPNDDGEWLCRHDAFSSYRAGFEVRTYRLCQRVLIFHHFPDEQDVGQDCLVRSTDFIYRDIRNNSDDLKKGHPIASFIASITQSGYKRQAGGYIKKSLPPVEFEYSQATVWHEAREIDAASVENLPYGIDGSHYQWVDLDGEGAPGILTQQADGWFYKRNLSPLTIENNGVAQTVEARFAATELIPEQPSLANIRNGRQQLLDLDGDGQIDLVEFDRPLSGFYERTYGESWSEFVPFKSAPTIAWNNPNVKFFDLTGDGKADIIIAEDDVFIWHPSLGVAGFGAAERVQQSLDEEKGPHLVFADSTQSIYLADLSGDGLTDIVRIRNGEISYWPNLGYGRFGAKVTMDNAPWFDAHGLFDQNRIRVADVDGSGTSDIIYMGRDGVDLYFNESGNSWSDAHRLSNFPQVDSLSSVFALDLLGNGTACLVWSSTLPAQANRHMRYVDLMGGQKPHLLVKFKNNLGSETRVHYAPSTKFYLSDRFAGKPWVTKLPFPVHVVERLEIIDHINRNRFITRYAYHHGYFDGSEREFRGFGMVEQWDTEEFATLNGNAEFSDLSNIDAASHIPPVLTRTWYHTGAWIEGHPLSRQFEPEYYREGDPGIGEKGLSDEHLQGMLLDDTIMPDAVKLQDGERIAWEISAEEAREACRTLKGSILRREVYALDATQEADRPYSVSEHNYTVEMLQPREPNKHAIFFAYPRESVEFHYERKLFDLFAQKVADPRVTHVMTLAVDGFGNVLQSVSVGYGRRHDDLTPLLTDEDRQNQKRSLITYVENRYTNSVDEADAYRAPLLCESHAYQLYNVNPGKTQPGITSLFGLDEMAGKVEAVSDGLHDIAYENISAEGVDTAVAHRRLIEQSRTLYRKNDLSGPLTLGGLESRALPFENYKLAFTQGLLSSVYIRKQDNQPPESLLPVPVDALRDEGGYRDLDGDGSWWIPSARTFFHPDPNATPALELNYARNHFFLPHRFEDVFSNRIFVSYDKDGNGADYDLLVTTTTDELGNQVSASHDYRVLQPRLVADANGNQSAVAFDALGMVVGTAQMGKLNEQVGDSLMGFDPDLDEATIIAHLQNPLADPHSILNKAGTRLVYDFNQYLRTSASADPQPNVVYMLSRETHDADLAPGKLSSIQHSFTYSDGLGREIQKKIQAEPGPMAEGEPVINPRWVGTGWTIFNNKGKPVRQYEPFFSVTHRFEFAKTTGVSPILFYDPVGRVVATLHPDHTYEKVVFDPWGQQTWDANDTILQADPKNDPDVGQFFARLPDAEYLPTWHTQRQGAALGIEQEDAANKAAVHSGTSTVAFFDTLGRVFLTVAHNRFERNGATFEEKYSSRISFDVEGNQRHISDARNRVVVRYDYNLLGSNIRQASMEAAEQWGMNDVLAKPLRVWDSFGRAYRTEYDQLRRAVRSHVKGADPQDANLEILYKQVIYGDGLDSGLTEDQKQQMNLRGKIYKQFDNAGVITNLAYDFKGNLLSNRRQLVSDYKTIPDWSANPALDQETFISSGRYDAINRAIQLVLPHVESRASTDVVQQIFNEAGLLEKIDVWLKHAGEPNQILDPQTADLHLLEGIEYNCRGQRESIKYGNGVTTIYRHDPLTFRLVHLFTTRGATFPDDCPNPSAPPCGVQNLRYTYDPVGNITRIRDDAQQTIYFRNRRVEPTAEYSYDALYRLIEAKGREHLGQAAAGDVLPPAPTSHTDAPRAALLHPGDGNAMGRYLQQYIYDEVGNILQMIHSGSDPANPGWSRAYTYDEPSLLEAGKTNNRLTRTQMGNGAVDNYTYDANGSMTAMPHLPLMRWDHEDRLQAISRQVVNKGGTPETTYYVYGSDGQRVRKVTERQAAANQSPARKTERIYLGSFEIYREYNSNGDNVTLERETLHLVDNKQRVAIVETRTEGSDGSPAKLIRYQFGNHLGSASLELDAQAQIVSYEEYYPYGSTSYQAARSQTETPKRYRYTGKERDDESGLYYHGSRYYAPWLGRWTAADPAGVKDGLNIYSYVGNNPVMLHDPSGTQGEYTQPATPDEAAKYYNNDCIIAVGDPGLLCKPPERSIPSLSAPVKKPGQPAQRAPKPKPKPKPKKKEPKPVSAQTLRDIAEALQPRLEYQKPVRQFFGGVQFVGGGLEAMGGYGLAFSTGVTWYGLVGGIAMGAHGLDVASSGWTAMTTGQGSRTYTFMAGAGWAHVAGADDKMATAMGESADMLANVGSFALGMKMASTPFNIVEPPPYKLIFYHGRVVGHHVVTVSAPSGPKAFYRRIGGGGFSGGAKPGKWAPFEGFSSERGFFAYHGKVYDARAEPWFVKHRFDYGFDENDPLHRFGTVENLEISNWLNTQSLPLEGAIEEPFQVVQAELNFFGVKTLDPIPLYGRAGSR
ncbi:MAG TPA: SpvB/TcaC N-terminal domain-containing protein [Blastocatellia bacterium]|nr:SpvB/TcaC N-terminal domain-containing protein [Blastocatellia bacterium]